MWKPIARRTFTRSVDCVNIRDVAENVKEMYPSESPSPEFCLVASCSLSYDDSDFETAFSDDETRSLAFESDMEPTFLAVLLHIEMSRLLDLVYGQGQGLRI
ncbi:unnamed protein product [Schistocephalus solidus]|uniref:Uncharacterized protein n=1 Tax=Schistocephalus solidus TaxID=70667 RepID=A0A183TNR8_SCHSO|nr:unnamed protein product [Schistocephalus solidus]